MAHLHSGDAAPPLTESELQPYLQDLLDAFQVTGKRDPLCQIAAGQPFRLGLWKLLAQSWHDCDASFLDTLQYGVRLGVQHPLEPSPASPVRLPTAPSDEPLMECSSAWKSARDNMPLVEELVKSEMEAGVGPWSKVESILSRPNTTKLRLGSLAWSWLKVDHPDWLWIVQFRM